MPWTLSQVAEHNSSNSCWVIINSKVYDVTEFLPNHPGGAKIILKYAGKDATSAYEPIHPPDALDKNLPPEKHLGNLDEDAANKITDIRANKAKSIDEVRIEQAQKAKPPLSQILCIAEMEEVARKVMSYKALSYYSSAADDEITHVENARAYARFFFLPRVLKPVTQCDPSTTILGFRSSIPVFCSGAALAKLGHPLGEANITRGTGRTNVIQMVSSNASLSYAQIASARIRPNQPLFFQLYKHSNDAMAEERVREVEALGYKAIFLTVDAPVAGNRERDVRAPFVLEAQEVEAEAKEGREEKPAQKAEDVEKEELENALVEGGGTAGGLIGNDYMDLTWEKTIPWLRKTTKLPVVLKGIQCVEDAVLAVEHGVDGIMLSNHGGRQLEFALPPLELLYRLRKQRPDVFDKTEVYIDGGIRRGTGDFHQFKQEMLLKQCVFHRRFEGSLSGSASRWSWATFSLCAKCLWRSGRREDCAYIGTRDYTCDATARGPESRGTWAGTGRPGRLGASSL